LLFVGGREWGGMGEWGVVRFGVVLLLAPRGPVSLPLDLSLFNFRTKEAGPVFQFWMKKGEKGKIQIRLGLSGMAA